MLKRGLPFTAPTELSLFSAVGVVCFRAGRADSQSRRSTCDHLQLRNSRVPTSKAIPLSGSLESHLRYLRTVLAGGPYASTCGSCRTRSGDLVPLLANSGWVRMGVARGLCGTGLSICTSHPHFACSIFWPYFFCARFGRELHLRQIEPSALASWHCPVAV